ncbi:MAG: class I SAM-dependent methyltransferase [Candidatus Bathyarchaeia archaeon]
MRIYSRPKVASHYGALSQLTDCERYLFGIYLKRRMRILDLGVGGGRTTPYLSSLSKNYVGVDYSEEMIRVCRSKFPDKQFIMLDASDLSRFEDSSFDAIVFSFNGLDILHPDAKRLQCLRECHRTLSRNGILIFSSHNAKSLLFRPVFFTYLLLSYEAFATAKLLRYFWILRNTIRLMKQPSAVSAFCRGDGYMMDPASEGALTHVCTPEHVTRELHNAGFELLEVVGNDFPKPELPLVTSWYYYVSVKR